jgi:hypothetical protein
VTVLSCDCLVLCNCLAWSCVIVPCLAIVLSRFCSIYTLSRLIIVSLQACLAFMQENDIKLVQIGMPGNKGHRRNLSGLSCLFLYCLALPCPVVSCRVVSCLVLSCLVLTWSCFALACLVLPCLALCCVVSSRPVLSCLVLSFLMLPCLRAVLSFLVSSCLFVSRLLCFLCGRLIFCLLDIEPFVNIPEDKVRKVSGSSILSCLVLSCLALPCLVLPCLAGRQID